MATQLAGNELVAAGRGGPLGLAAAFDEEAGEVVALARAGEGGLFGYDPLNQFELVDIATWHKELADLAGIRTTGSTSRHRYWLGSMTRL